MGRESFAKGSFAMGRNAATAVRRPLRSSGRTVPALVIEGQAIPKVPVDTALGAVMTGSGAILVGEGLLSIFLSADQSTLSTVFRLARIGIGGGLLVWVAASSVGA